MKDRGHTDAWYKSSCHVETSLWGKTAMPLPRLPVLNGKYRSDVAVIGAGFCGLSTALHLSERGYEVILIDAHEPGWGASGRNGGQVIPGLKIMPNEMVKRYGVERGERIAKTAGSAPQLVFNLIERHGIDCDLRKTGWIQLAKGPRGSVTINSHVEQWGERGADVGLLDRSDIEIRVGTGAYQQGLIDMRGGNLHPLKYARGLARACLASGVSIYWDSPAHHVERIENSWRVCAQYGSIDADIVVVCTNAYTGDMLPGLADSIIPVLTGVVATDPLGDNLAKKILPKRQGAADTRRLLSWFGLDGTDRLIFGSRINTQKELIDEKNFSFGINRLHEIFPEISQSKLNHMWTGRVALTLDHVPHIHKLAEGLYSGLGFNGRGVAMATMFGKVLADHCSGTAMEGGFLPITPVRKVPFSRFRNQGIAVVLTWKRMMDTLQP